VFYRHSSPSPFASPSSQATPRDNSASRPPALPLLLLAPGTAAFAFITSACAARSSSFRAEGALAEGEQPKGEAGFAFLAVTLDSGKPAGVQVGHMYNGALRTSIRFFYFPVLRDETSGVRVGDTGDNAVKSGVMDIFSDIEAGQEAVSLNEARNLPALKRNGKGVNLPSIYRWTSEGIRGVKLETVQIGGSRCTTAGAAMRFIRALSALPPETKDPSRRARQIERAKAVCKAAGI
jgi:hypothetical protein